MQRRKLFKKGENVLENISSIFLNKKQIYKYVHVYIHINRLIKLVATLYFKIPNDQL